MYAIIVFAFAACLIAFSAISAAVVAKIRSRFVRWSVWILLQLQILGVLYGGRHLILTEEQWYYVPLTKRYQDKWADTPSTILLLTVSALLLVVLPNLFASTCGLFGSPPRAANWSLRRLFKCCAAGVVGIVVAVVLQDIELQWRFHKLDQAARELADSMTPPPVPAEENAARLYERAVDTIGRLSEHEPKFESVMEFGYRDPIADQFFAQRASALTDLRDGAMLEYFRLSDKRSPLDSIYGSEVQSSLVDGALLLNYSAQYSVVQGDAAAALDDVRTIRQMQRHIMSDPRNLTSYVIAWYDVSIGRAMESILWYDPNVDRETLLSFINDGVDMPTFMKSALTWNEAANKLLVAQSYLGTLPTRTLTETGKADEAPIRRELRLALMRFHSGRDDLASVMQQYAAAQGDVERFRSKTDQSQEESETIPNGIDSAVAGTDISLAWSGLGSWHDALARRNVMLAATLFKYDNDRYPNTIAELPPGLLKEDPEGIALKPFPDGLIVYSWRDEYDHKHPDEARTMEGLASTLYLGAAYEKYRKHFDETPIDELVARMRTQVLESPDGALHMGWRIRLWRSMRVRFRDDYQFRKGALAYFSAKFVLEHWEEHDDENSGFEDDQYYVLDQLRNYLLLGEERPYFESPDLDAPPSPRESVANAVGQACLETIWGNDDGFYKERGWWERARHDELIPDLTDAKAKELWRVLDTHCLGSIAAAGGAAWDEESHGGNATLRRQYWLHWLSEVLPLALLLEDELRARLEEPVRSE